MKRTHEERIRLLTEMSDDAETVVLRVVGGIRGAPVEIAREAVQAAVRADGRFPRYRFALAGDDVEVDLSRLPDDGDPAYWEMGVRAVRQAAEQLQRAQQPVRHLSVFALSRIPLLVALGFFLDDKIPTAIYQRRRDGTGDQGWGFDPAAPLVSFQSRRVGGAEESTRVALAVSVTAPIGADVVHSVPDSIVYELSPASAPPGRNLLAARESLDAFADAYHRFLATVENDHPQCEAIELFVAAPASAAVQLGRGIMREAQPPLHVYDRISDGRFELALSLS
jgi:hypothetical protein